MEIKKHITFHINAPQQYNWYEVGNCIKIDINTDNMTEEDIKQEQNKLFDRVFTETLKDAILTAQKLQLPYHENLINAFFEKPINRHSVNNVTFNCEINKPIENFNSKHLNNETIYDQVGHIFDLPGDSKPSEIG